MTDDEHDDHHHHGGGPGWGLVLLIPAALIVAKATRHRRAMWGPAAWAPPGPGDAETAFRLPPRIEWMLDTWHKRAHERVQPTETASAK